MKSCSQFWQTADPMTDKRQKTAEKKITPEIESQHAAEKMGKEDRKGRKKKKAGKRRKRKEGVKSQTGVLDRGSGVIYLDDRNNC